VAFAPATCTPPPVPHRPAIVPSRTPAAGQGHDGRSERADGLPVRQALQRLQHITVATTWAGTDGCPPPWRVRSANNSDGNSRWRWSARKAYTDPSGTRRRHQVEASSWASAARRGAHAPAVCPAEANSANHRIDTANRIGRTKPFSRILTWCPASRPGVGARTRSADPARRQRSHASAPPRRPAERFDRHSTPDTLRAGGQAGLRHRQLAMTDGQLPQGAGPRAHP
jgi:hypothetical protein